MSKHTPSPWEKVYDTAGITRGIRGRHGPEIVNVINWNGISRSTSVTGQANANLIVAAPDLLEALQNIAEYWNQDQNEAAMADACWHAIHTASAAIAKATGDQQ